MTLRITLGRRPDLLRQTLSALLHPPHFDSIIAINDLSDDETNQVFKELCPLGRLISLDLQLGHHATVDLMYGLDSTPWVFYGEDDWLFEKHIVLQWLIWVLKSDASTSAICLRQLSDFYLKPEDDRKVRFENHGGLDFFRQTRCKTNGIATPSISTWHQLTCVLRSDPFLSFKKSGTFLEPFERWASPCLIGSMAAVTI